jgi:hypothetical protein
MHNSARTQQLLCPRGHTPTLARVIWAAPIGHRTVPRASSPSRCPRLHKHCVGSARRRDSEPTDRREDHQVVVADALKTEPVGRPENALVSRSDLHVFGPPGLVYCPISLTRFRAGDIRWQRPAQRERAKRRVDDPAERASRQASDSSGHAGQRPRPRSSAAQRCSSTETCATSKKSTSL